MIKLIKFLVVIIGLVISPMLLHAQQVGEVISPQFNMVGARLMSLGGTTPTIFGDVNGVFNNPAALGDIEFVQFSISQQEVLDEFDYKMLHVAIPGEDFTYSFSYGSDMLSGIPKTNIDSGLVLEDGETINDGNELVRGNINYDGTFASGFQVYHLGLGRTSYFDTFFLDRISYGFGLKALQQVVDTDSRFSFGVDAGAIGSFYFPGNTVERAHIGISFINLVATDLSEWQGLTASPLARQIFLGGRLDMFDNTFNLNASAYGITAIREYAIGMEYKMVNSLVLRGSVVADVAQTSALKYNMGTGLVFDRVAGWGAHEYDLRMDYNLQMNPFPFENEDTHTISFSLLGQSRVIKPKLLHPTAGFRTRDRHINIKGMAGRRSKVLIYNNNSESRSAKADSYGRWSYAQFPLQEGENIIHLKAEKIGLDMSYKTQPVVIISDNTSPTFTMETWTERNQLFVGLSTSEIVKDVRMHSNGRSRQFVRMGEQKWRLLIPLPKQYRNGAFLSERITTYSIEVKDLVGNTAEPRTEKYLLSLSNPKDKSIVYSNKITALGYASSAIKTLKINGRAVMVDDKFAFSHTVPLKYGKNVVKVDTESHNGDKMSFYSRVLAIRKFPDIPRKFKGRRDI